MAFARSLDGRHSVTISARLSGEMQGTDMSNWWRDTAVKVPLSSAEDRWKSQLFPEVVSLYDGAIHVADALAKLPVAVLVN
jgi:maltooligosyltrehalose synthase